MRFRQLGPLAWAAKAARCVGKGALAWSILPELDLQWRGVGYPDGGPGHALWDWRDLPVEAARMIVGRACKPMLSAEQAEALAQMAGHLRFASDYPEINCDNCLKMQELDEAAYDCGQCGFVPVPRSLAPLKEVFELAGGARVGGLERVARLCRMMGHDDDWALYLQLQLLSVYRNSENVNK